MHVKKSMNHSKYMIYTVVLEIQEIGGWEAVLSWQLDSGTAS
jgi:hypothetical protein